MNPYPPVDFTVDVLFTAARRVLHYANVEHPVDIANVLTAAIESNAELLGLLHETGALR